MAAGAFAGIAEHCASMFPLAAADAFGRGLSTVGHALTNYAIVYPIDAVKTRMQIVNANPTAVYNGVIQSTYRIASTEGVFSLWRGMSSVIAGAG